MKSFQREVQLHTAGGLRVTDITDEVADAVRESGVRDGICSVYSPHTTCSVRVNEWERGFLEDFAMMLKRLVPTERYYAHDDWDRRTENISPDDPGTRERARALHVDAARAGGRVDPRPRRRALPRHLAARALSRTRPRARPALARPARRPVARGAFCCWPIDKTRARTCADGCDTDRRGGSGARGRRGADRVSGRRRGRTGRPCTRACPALGAGGGRSSSRWRSIAAFTCSTCHDSDGGFRQQS